MRQVIGVCEEERKKKKKKETVVSMKTGER